MGLYTRIADIDDAIDDLIDMENEFEAINIGTAKDFVKGFWDGLMDMIPDSLLGWVVVGAAVLIGAGLLYIFGPIVLVVGGALAIGFAIYGSYQLYQEGNSLAYSIGHGLPMAIMGAMGMKGGAAAMAESGWTSASSYGKVGQSVSKKGISFYEYKGSKVPEVMGEDGLAKIPPGREVKIGDNTYVQNDSLFDINQVDKRGRTNLERMQEGLAPQNQEGKSINLHHELQKNDGRRVEVTKEEHTGKHGELHPNGKSEVDRNAFKKERENYWQNRANEIKKIIKEKNEKN